MGQVPSPRLFLFARQLPVTSLDFSASLVTVQREPLYKCSDLIGKVFKMIVRASVESHAEFV